MIKENKYEVNQLKTEKVNVKNRPSFIVSNSMTKYFEEINGLNKPQRYFYNFIYNRK